MGKVNSMELFSFQRYKEGQLKGHIFNIDIDLTDIDECELLWFERTNLPYVDQGTWQPGVWKDMFGQEESLVFKPWHDCAGTSGRQIISIFDPPGTRSGNRVLDFCIACHDDNKQGYVFQFQQVIGRREYKVRGNDKVDPDAYTFQYDNNKDAKEVDVEQVLSGPNFRYIYPYGPNMPWMD